MVVAYQLSIGIAHKRKWQAPQGTVRGILLELGKELSLYPQQQFLALTKDTAICSRKTGYGPVDQLVQYQVGPMHQASWRVPVQAIPLTGLLLGTKVCPGMLQNGADQPNIYLLVVRSNDKGLLFRRKGLHRSMDLFNGIATHPFSGISNKLPFNSNRQGTLDLDETNSNASRLAQAPVSFAHALQMHRVIEDKHCFTIERHLGGHMLKDGIVLVAQPSGPFAGPSIKGNSVSLGQLLAYSLCQGGLARRWHSYQQGQSPASVL